MKSFIKFVCVIFVLGATPVAASDYNLPPHLESVPLPDEITFRKPHSSVPEEYVAFLGAWGSEKKFHRPVVIVVTRVRKSGRVNLILAMGDSPRFPVWYKKYSGRISGKTLIFKEDQRTTFELTRDGADMSALVKREGNAWGIEFERFRLTNPK